MHFSSIPEIIRTWGQLKRDQLAISSSTRDWSFGDLDRESSRVAQGLCALGVGAGDRVAALTRNAPECLVLCLGAGKIGAVMTPLNWRLVRPELEYVVTHSEARLIMADLSFIETVRQLRLPNAPRIVATEGSDPDTLLGWAAAFDSVDPDYWPASDETGLQLYSSGTTGKPKGVELTHAGLLCQCNLVTENFGYRRGEPVVHLDVLPSFHVSGIVMNSLALLHEAAIAVTRPKFELDEIIETINRHRVTSTFLVPVMMRMLAHAVTERKIGLPSLRTVGYGGSPVNETIVKEVRSTLGCDLIQIFGMTELGGVVACLAAEDHDNPELLRSAGRPLAGVKMRIVDIADLSLCAEGEPGELWVQSELVMKGYFRNPQASRDALPELPGDGRWLRTGDVGIMKNGYLFIRDRLKEMVISGGENIYPAEVENVIAAHPAVADVAVIGVPDPKWGEAVKACVVLKPGAKAEEREIIAFTRELLAHYKCPKSVDFVAALPRNPSGKLLKRVLREPYWRDYDNPI